MPLPSTLSSLRTKATHVYFSKTGINEDPVHKRASGVSHQRRATEQDWVTQVMERRLRPYLHFTLRKRAAEWQFAVKHLAAVEHKASESHGDKVRLLKGQFADLQLFPDVVFHA